VVVLDWTRLAFAQIVAHLVYTGISDVVVGLGVVEVVELSTEVVVDSEVVVGMIEVVYQQSAQARYVLNTLRYVQLRAQKKLSRS
jgi:hypothetical protein